MIQYWTLAFLTLTGLAYGQEIIIPPADTTAVVGSTISFFCRVGFGPIETMSWEFNEAIVYSLQDDYEHYPCISCGNKYAVTRNAGNFTLHVNALDLNDGGKYTCIAMVPSATAALIVLDTPKISNSTLSSAEGTIAEYTCKAQFARPPKNEILPEQNPVLEMFLAGDTLIGEKREENCYGLNCYFYTQTKNISLEASMNGEQLMCDISTLQPPVHVNSSTMITVLYPVRSVSYTPDNKQYEVGTKITCSADGNPKPTYAWNNMNTGQSIDGQTLDVTEEILGPNTWRCKAKNFIEGTLHEESTAVAFIAVMPEDYKETENASLGIGLGVTFAVCVLAIILTLLYCRIKHKKPTCHLPIRTKGQKSQDQVVKANKTKASDTTQKMELPSHEYLSSRGEMFPGGDKGRKMKEIHAPDTDETAPLLTTNTAEDSNTDESKDEYSKQQSLKLQETPCNSTIPEIQDQDTEDPQSSETQLIKTSENKNTDANNVQDKNSRSENSDGSRPVPENDERSTSDGVHSKEQKPEDNQNSNSGNADGSLSENDDTAKSKAMSQGTSSENDTSSNHSSNSGTEDDAGAITTTVLQPQDNTEKTQPIPYHSDMSQSEKFQISVSPPDTGETGNELDEADKESHSTEKETNQPLYTEKQTHELEGTVEKTVEEASQAVEVQDDITPPDSPIPPSRQMNQESMNIPSDRQGNFGEIVNGRHRGMDITLFKSKEFQTEDQRIAFTHGGNILKKYEHGNIAKFLFMTVKEKLVFMVMEYECGGVLQQFLKERAKELKNFQLIRICEDVLQAMIYLEKQPCIHRALSACNCLVGENNIVKIWNFSFAIEEIEYNGDPQEEVPIRSASLEALKDGKYSLPSDVWSFGVLMWEVFSHGKTPYGEDGKTKEKLLSWLERGNRLEVPKGTPQIIGQLIKTCCKVNPTTRPALKNLQAKLMDAR